MNKTVFLNNLLEQSLKDAHGEPLGRCGLPPVKVANPEGNWFIEWRPFKGWYAVPDSIRHWGDEGEFLGENWKRAVKGIRGLFG